MKFWRVNMVNDKMGASELPLAGITTEDGNSEHFYTGDWRTKKPVHLSEKCKHCMLCILPCPDDATTHDGHGKMTGIDYNKCKGCGICAKVCPFKAIEMVDEDEEVVENDK